jgi:RNA polymerase sigma-70 factor (ECF subfamily)
VIRSRTERVDSKVAPAAGVQDGGLNPPRGTESLFDDDFRALFDMHHARIYRFLDRISGDPELAADVAQDAFIRLYRRGALPRSPEAWLITVSMNLYRNARTGAARRARLLSAFRSAAVAGDAPPAPDEEVAALETRRRVRHAIELLPEREQRLLLLRAEGFRYADIARALRLNEASVGTLIARARRAFRENFEKASHAR